MKYNEDKKWVDWNPVTMMRSAVLALMVCLFICLLFAGCSPRVVETVVVRTDTLIQTQVKNDSVVMRDSVYVHEWMAGDTVFVEHWHRIVREAANTGVKERLRTVHDTVFVDKADTIASDAGRKAAAKVAAAGYKKDDGGGGAKTVVMLVVLLLATGTLIYKLRKP